MGLSEKAMQDAIAAIESQYPDTIHTGEQTEDVSWLSTGSLELDFAMGGGIPMGNFSRFYGPWSCGKSLVAWQAVKSAQQAGMTCAYYNVEKSYDKKFVKSLGVDVSKLIIVEGTIIEEIVTKMETLMTGVNLHIIDSASSAVAMDELSAKAEDQFIGLGARTWGRGLRRLLNRFDKNENTVIIIDQVRSSIRFGANDEPPGGKMMEHTSSMTVSFVRGGWLFRGDDGYLYEKKRDTKSLSDLMEPDGVEYKAYVKKSRVGRPFRNARLYYDFAQRSFDPSYEYFQAARFFDVISGTSWYTMPDGTKLQGEPKVREAIMKDPKLRKVIRETVMSHAG